MFLSDSAGLGESANCFSVKTVLSCLKEQGEEEAASTTGRIFLPCWVYILFVSVVAIVFLRFPLLTTENERGRSLLDRLEPDFLKSSWSVKICQSLFREPRSERECPFSSKSKKITTGFLSPDVSETQKAEKRRLWAFRTLEELRLFNTGKFI